MRNFGLFIVGILILLIILNLTNAKADLAAGRKAMAQAQGRALIIEANSQARLNDATARATTLSAALPMMILASLSFLGLATIALVAFLATARPSSPQPPVTIIEKQIYFLPAGTPRREVWQLLASNQPRVLEIPVNNDR